MSKEMITISHSKLQQFLSGCPAKVKFYEKYNMKKMPPALDFGIRVHSMIEEGLPNPHPEPDEVLAHDTAERLLNLVEKKGYVILDQEVRHLARLTDDIQVFGIIDAIASLDGEPVLVDFKTGAYGWKKTKTAHGEIVVPKASGFQGAIYLTKPYPESTSDYWDGGVWPGEMHYLLAPKNGTTQIHKYHENDWDRQNLIHAAQLYAEAERTGKFPKNKGWLCSNCDWFHACWETKGWEDRYIERD